MLKESSEWLYAVVCRCYYDCVHGRCTSAPNYICQCDIGWTKPDCNVNCGCNNHSTCMTGVGFCDECLDWTMGDQCQLCRPGSYGDAKSVEGETRLYVPARH